VARALGPQNLRALRDMASPAAAASSAHAASGPAGGLGLDFGPAAAAHEGAPNAAPRGGSGSDEEEYGSSGEEDLDLGYDPVYGIGLACTNCTAMLYSDVVCPVRLPWAKSGSLSDASPLHDCLSFHASDLSLPIGCASLGQHAKGRWWAVQLSLRVLTQRTRRRTAGMTP
jgi:hypothetical protein